MAEPALVTQHVHVFPVDPSLTPAQAWGEICNFGRRVTYTGRGTWANTVCDGEECRNVMEAADA